MKGQSDFIGKGKSFSRLSHRRGTVMVYLAVILPIMFGVLALVMDFGLGAVTQRTMQTAADNAAVEGLLIRDQGMAEIDQRLHVRETIQQQFDDDMLDPGDVDGDQQFGAGMILPVTTAGRTELNGSETVAYGNILPYDPDPQLNLLSDGNNLAHGDMVSGYYNAGSRHDEGYNVNAYDRDDFTPQTVGSTTPANMTDAFLVRLRRTPDAADNDATVASSGGAVPALFSRGTLAKATEPGTASIRKDGLPVRATSIASAEKTTTIGPMIPDALTGGSGDIEGYYPFILSIDEWANIPLNGSLVYEVLDTGEIIPEGLLTTVGGVFRVAHHADSIEPEDLSAILAADTTIPIHDDQAFTDAQVTIPFMIRIDDEIMRVTGRTGSAATDDLEWIVDRGVAGSIAADHSNAALIFLHEPATIGDSAQISLRPLQPGSGGPPPFFNIDVSDRRYGSPPGTAGFDFHTYIRFTYDGAAFGVDPDVYVDEVFITIPELDPNDPESWKFDIPGNSDKPNVGAGSDIAGSDVVMTPNGGTPNELKLDFRTSPVAKQFTSGKTIIFGGGLTDYFTSAENWAYSGITMRVILSDGSVYSFGFIQDPPPEEEGWVIAGADDSQDTIVLFDEANSKLYLPLFDPALGRIVAFGRADMVYAGETNGPHTIRITKLPQIVAPKNASANFGSGFNRMGTPAMTPAQIQALFLSRRAFDDEPLRSPASVSSMSR